MVESRTVRLAIGSSGNFLSRSRSSSVPTTGFHSSPFGLRIVATASPVLMRRLHRFVAKGVISAIRSRCAGVHRAHSFVH